jgi:Phospholipase_D-nuclease N-terminal
MTWLEGHDWRMFRVAVFLSVASVLLAALALISCLSIEDKRQIRGMPRYAWVIAILLVPLAGAIAWFGYGRPRRAGGARSGWRQATRRPEPPQRRAPDDDPDFLRSLDSDTISKDEEELLRRWEEDLRRRDPGTEP